MAELLEQVKVVAEAREKARKAAEAGAAAMEAWEKENGLLLTSIAETKRQVIEAEATLRELTLKAYQETGSKAPAPGVGIRIVTRLIYDGDTALRWAKEHQLCLMLDKRSFEKVAKAQRELPFVTYDDEPQAIIAIDLSTVLKEEQRDGNHSQIS